MFDSAFRPVFTRRSAIAGAVAAGICLRLDEAIALYMRNSACEHYCPVGAMSVSSESSICILEN